MQLTAVQKGNPALRADGNRTVYGYFDEGDIPLLAKEYPMIGEAVIAKIASAINAPRLLEVTTVLEVTHRYIEGTFSRIRGLGIHAVSNPLSVLFFNQKERRVQRIKTRESELMHGACEKLALHTDGVNKVNDILKESFGLQIAFGCSCCAIIVKTADIPALFASKHYRMRETAGRNFDSDVLCVSGDLFSAGSVSDLPAGILDNSSDFHEEEVESYLRFARINDMVVARNVVSAHPPVDEELIEFLTGERRIAA
ncbi:MAG TPA: hypothetical protein VHD38_02665 [Candidatus Paceibacterota bacterium]|nr:hypothetical protein [Candidatus Paceibacterota bacterium]